MGKKSAYNFSTIGYLQQELVERIKTVLPSILQNIKDGKFECFDAILGDGGCQLRAFYITNLYTSGVMETLSADGLDIDIFVSSVLGNTIDIEKHHLYNLCLLYVFAELNERNLVYNVIVAPKSQKHFPLKSDIATNNLKHALGNFLKAYLINFTATYFKQHSGAEDLLEEEHEFKLGKNKEVYKTFNLGKAVEAIVDYSKDIVVVVDRFSYGQSYYSYLETSAYLVNNAGVAMPLEEQDDLSPRTVVRGYSICTYKGQFGELANFHEVFLKDASLQSTTEGARSTQFYGPRETGSTPSLPGKAMDFTTYHSYSAFPSEVLEGIKQSSATLKRPFNELDLNLLLASQEYRDLDQVPIYEQLPDNVIRDHGAQIVDLNQEEYPDGADLLGYTQIPTHGSNIFIGYYNRHYVVLLQNEGHIDILDPLGTDIIGIGDIAIDGFDLNYYCLWLTRAYRG